MKVKVIKHKKVPAPVATEQVKRNISELIQRFLRSEGFIHKSETAVKPENLYNLYGCTNAKN